MAVESASDRAAFFNADEFGATFAWTLAAGGDPTDVEAIFDNEFIAVDPGAGVAISSQDPRIQAPVASLPAGYGRGDTVSITGHDVIPDATYKARDFEPDGTGLVFVVLEKQ